MAGISVGSREDAIRNIIEPFIRQQFCQVADKVVAEKIETLRKQYILELESVLRQASIDFTEKFGMGVVEIILKDNSKS